MRNADTVSRPKLTTKTVSSQRSDTNDRNTMLYVYRAIGYVGRALLACEPKEASEG